MELSVSIAVHHKGEQVMPPVVYRYTLQSWEDISYYHSQLEQLVIYMRRLERAKITTPVATA